MTRVVNLYKEPYDIYIGRTGKGRKSLFGNPFSVKDFGRDGCIEKFEEYIRNKLNSDEELVKELLLLDGKVLGCFCKPQKCHGDVLVTLINEYKRK